MTEHTIFIPAPRDRKGRIAWINANHRTHWAVKAANTKSWRTAAWAHARRAQLPQGLERIHVTAYVHKTDNRSYDVHNLLPTMKAVIDGLVDYGLVDDDDNSRLIGPDMRHGTKRDQAGITITIKETT